MSKFYIVWNQARSEGVIFDNPRDAKAATNGRPTPDPDLGGMKAIASLAAAFHECYEDEKLKVEVLDLAALMSLHQQGT